MSRKTKTIATKEEATPALTPKLRFPEFQDSEGWQTKFLGDLSKIRTGKKDANEGASDGQYPFFTCAENHIFSHTYSFDAEAILIAGNANVGQTRYYHGKFEAYQRTYVLTDFSGIDVPYLYSILNAKLRESLLEQVQVSAMSYIKLPMLQEYALPVPPTSAEQQKIAECLSSLDELMAAKARKVDALKTHKKGLMQQLFPRQGESQPRLRFPEFHNAGEWECTSLGGALDRISNGLSLTQGNDASGYRTTRIETISSGAIDLERVGYVDTTQDISTYRLNVGDILFSNINSIAHIGKSVFVDADYDLYHGMNLLRLVAKRSKCEPKFLFYLINTNCIRESFRERANKAVNQASINRTELGKTELAFPSLAEQQRIADCLSSFDALITAETRKLEALKTHKKGLMQQLFPVPNLIQ